MKVQLALAASPLTTLHQSQSFDVKSLKHQITDIPEFRQGRVVWDIVYDSVGNDKPHHSAKVDIQSDMGYGYLEFELIGRHWHYTGETVINGEKTEYEGKTAHNSIQAICRKVRGLTLTLL